MRASSAPSARVLAFQLHAGSSGQCVLDGFGLAPGGWKTSRVATRTTASLVHFIQRAVTRYRPAVVVLGVSRRDALSDAPLRDRAAAALRRRSVPFVIRHMREAYGLLRDHIRGTRREELAYTLVEGFLPDLRSHLVLKRLRERRSAWHALALALVELVHRFPRAAAALATARAFSIRPFREAVVKAEMARHPDPV